MEGIVIIIFLVNRHSKKFMETPFIAKLRKILQDEALAPIISWGQQKRVIQIRDEKTFEEIVLPVYFRHRRLASFIRQLNLYGFRKIRSTQIQTFTHKNLEKGQGIKGIFSQKKNNLLPSDSPQNLEDVPQISRRLEEVSMAVIPEADEPIPTIPTIQYMMPPTLPSLLNGNLAKSQYQNDCMLSWSYSPLIYPGGTFQQPEPCYQNMGWFWVLP